MLGAPADRSRRRNKSLWEEMDSGDDPLNHRRMATMTAKEELGKGQMQKTAKDAGWIFFLAFGGALIALCWLAVKFGG